MCAAFAQADGAQLDGRTLAMGAAYGGSVRALRWLLRRRHVASSARESFCGRAAFAELSPRRLCAYEAARARRAAATRRRPPRLPPFTEGFRSRRPVHHAWASELTEPSHNRRAARAAPRAPTPPAPRRDRAAATPSPAHPSAPPSAARDGTRRARATPVCRRCRFAPTAARRRVWRNGCVCSYRRWLQTRTCLSTRRALRSPASPRRTARRRRRTRASPSPPPRPSSERPTPPLPRCTARLRCSCAAGCRRLPSRSLVPLTGCSRRALPTSTTHRRPARLSTPAQPRLMSSGRRRRCRRARSRRLSILRAAAWALGSRSFPPRRRRLWRGATGR